MADPSTDITKLVHEPIDPVALAAYVRGNGDGAIVIFDGFVRDHSKNRRTLYLEYEAYEPMALAKIQEIAAHLHEQFPIHRVAMVHRLGRLEIGETSVYIAVSAAAPRRRLRRLPLRHRHPQTHCAYLEKRILRRRFRVGRWRIAARAFGDIRGETCILIT